MKNETGTSEDTMDELSCSLCGMELTNGDTVYGLTSGEIDNDCSGFRMSTDDDWDLYCRECMNQIDRLILAYKQHGLPQQDKI